MTAHGDATSHADTCLSHQAGTPAESARIMGGGAAHPSVPRHTDGANEHPQPHALPDAVLDIDNDGLAL